MKLLWMILLLPVILLAEAQPYLGVGGSSTAEMFTVENPGTDGRDESALFQAAQIKIGYGDPRAYAIEVALGYGRYDKNVFSEADTDYYYFDIALVKAFDIGWGFYPFLKIGMGTGELEVTRSTQSSLSSGSFFGGGGVYVPLGLGIELEASALYRGKHWEDADMIDAQTQSSSIAVEPYIGFNFRF